MYIILFCLGICIGSLFMGWIFRRYLIGDLRIDRSDTCDGPYLFLELNKGIDSFEKRPYVLLKVKDENFFPRK